MKSGIIAFLADVTGDPTVRTEFGENPSKVMDSYGLSANQQAAILAAGRAGQPTPALLAPIGQFVVDELSEGFQATW